MGIFERFHETIFLKEDSELETKIEKLKEQKKKTPNNKTLTRDLILLEKGLQGEKEIAFELKNATIGMYVLRDIHISYKDLNAQIDYVVVTPAYCYLIECKNLVGDITVNKEGEFKREYIIEGKKIKEGIYSPYTQANRHKEILKKRWLDKNNNLTNFLFEKTFDNYYKPLVVLANSKGLLNITFAPKEIKERTIRVDQLIDYMKKDLASIDWMDVSNKKQMKGFANSILNIHQKQVKDEKEKMEEETTLEEILKKYRTEKSKKMNVPAYYIFTNEELLNLVKDKPKTIEELEKVLKDVKVQYHGKEILELINSEKKIEK